MLSVDLPLSELALAYPAASRILRQHRLDFCCGGKRSVADACAERGIDAAALLRNIEASDRSPRISNDPRTLPLPDLVAHVLTAYHEAHRTELPDLIELARKVERVHARKPAVPAGLAAHLAGMNATLEAHMLKEELLLFPAILTGATAVLRAPISVMEAEHVEHGHALERMRELAHGFVPPEDACTSWRALYLRCEQLEADLMAHVLLENEVLFPRASRGDV